MKSIIEEASSITKAIEKGWIKAGSPKEFTVKIYQEPETNFFGLTKKLAKIAILFNEKGFTKTKTEKKTRIISKTSEDDKPKFINKTIKTQTKSAIWTKEMIKDTENLIEENFKKNNLYKPKHHVSTQHFLLKIQFIKSIFEDKMKEKKLFQNLSRSTLQMLRKKYRRPLKGYKVLILSLRDEQKS